MTLTYSPVPTIKVDDIISFDHVTRHGRISKRIRHIGTVVAVHKSGAITVKDHCIGAWSCFDPEHFDVRVISNRSQPPLRQASKPV